ncbi:hypothetical protein BegalDRAFT_1845 [Beggiatoa alba B18LD]|uniref:Endonuclease GajA/Old nuclease/RecF-like AAA domain-containing protein n=2 Tax=Beggiatoa alba TaxID=1022 RepID=I3CGH6_9GAMM|nr:hypothetical protein BegalDRAFT_1845 [Beggiatoa alba B18LD]
MRFSFENLGVLPKGEIELADLTVLCGANNTGKTYITYALYGFLKNWRNLTKIPSLEWNKLNNNLYEIDLEKQLFPKIQSILDEATKDYQKNLLHTVFGTFVERFSTTHLSFNIDNLDIVIKSLHHIELQRNESHLVGLKKQENSPILQFDFSSTKEQPNINAIYNQLAIKYICFAPFFPYPFIISTERTGAIAFQNDLNLGKSRLLELLNQGKQIDYHAQAQPIRDNIDFINSLSIFEKETSPLLMEYPDLLIQFKDIIGGDYRLNNGVLHFQPNKNTELRMNESSSVVRALVILGYYLKHLAKKGDLLMIDEPELNLHPANQRKLARLLVRLVNLGIKVFVTTHSDYIVKEFNTMIMLNNGSNRLQKIREKWHYTDDERLAIEKVKLYILREELISAGRGKKKRPICTVTPAKITPTFGIEVPTFDNTIDEMNAIQDEIYYSHQLDGNK